MHILPRAGRSESILCMTEDPRSRRRGIRIGMIRGSCVYAAACSCTRSTTSVEPWVLNPRTQTESYSRTYERLCDAVHGKSGSTSSVNLVHISDTHPGAGGTQISLCAFSVQHRCSFIPVTSATTGAEAEWASFNLWALAWRDQAKLSLGLYRHGKSRLPVRPP